MKITHTHTHTHLIFASDHRLRLSTVNQIDVAKEGGSAFSLSRTASRLRSRKQQGPAAVMPITLSIVPED